jgi:hypothetical protein
MRQLSLPVRVSRRWVPTRPTRSLPAPWSGLSALLWKAPVGITGGSERSHPPPEPHNEKRAEWAALADGVEAVSLAIDVTGVAIGQAGVGLVAGMLARAISCWVASLSPAAGRATLHMTMQANGGGARRGQRCR